MLLFEVEYNEVKILEICKNADDLYHVWLMTFFIVLCCIKLVLWGYHDTLYLKMILPMRKVFFFLP
jgi:hypothetical protein